MFLVALNRRAGVKRIGLHCRVTLSFHHQTNFSREGGLGITTQLPIQDGLGDRKSDDLNYINHRHTTMVMRAERVCRS